MAAPTEYRAPEAPAVGKRMITFGCPSESAVSLEPPVSFEPPANAQNVANMRIEAINRIFFIADSHYRILSFISTYLKDNEGNGCT